MFHGRQLLTEQQILKRQIAPAPDRLNQRLQDDL